MTIVEYHLIDGDVVAAESEAPLDAVVDEMREAMTALAEKRSRSIEIGAAGCPRTFIPAGALVKIVVRPDHRVL